MFNPKIPYNDLPKLNSIDFSIKNEYINLIIQANQEIGKLDWLASLLPNYEVLISPLIAKESVASNAIENINTTTVEFLQKEALWSSSLSWAEKEVQHYRNTLLQWIEMLKEQWWISANLLIELQSLIEPTKVGVRKIPWTVIANWLWKVIYTPPVWEQLIRNLLSDLENRIHKKDTIDPLVKMPVIHLQFESIHPFYDGNGRIGRILMMLYLMYAGKLQRPVLFLSSYIFKHRQKYYESLRRGNVEWDYDAIIIFLLQWVIEEAKNTQVKILEIHKCLDTSIKQFQEQWFKEYYNIAMAFFTSPFISVTNLTAVLGITRQSASTYIKKWEKAWIIKTIKVWSHKLSYLPPFIDLIK
jgi:Fic family protein